MFLPQSSCTDIPPPFSDLFVPPTVVLISESFQARSIALHSSITPTCHTIVITGLLAFHQCRLFLILITTHWCVVPCACTWVSRTAAWPPSCYQKLFRWSPSASSSIEVVAQWAFFLLFLFSQYFSFSRVLQLFLFVGYCLLDHWRFIFTVKTCVTGFMLVPLYSSVLASNYKWKCIFRFYLLPVLLLFSSWGSYRFALICDHFASVTTLSGSLRGSGHLFDKFLTFCMYFCTVVFHFGIVVGKLTPFSVLGWSTLSSFRIRSWKDPSLYPFSLFKKKRKKSTICFNPLRVETEKHGARNGVWTFAFFFFFLVFNVPFTNTFIIFLELKERKR